MKNLMLLLLMLLMYSCSAVDSTIVDSTIVDSTKIALYFIDTVTANGTPLSVDDPVVILNGDTLLFDSLTQLQFNTYEILLPEGTHNLQVFHSDFHDFDTNFTVPGNYYFPCNMQPLQADYFPLAIGNKWYYTVTAFAYNAFADRYSLNGELSWEIVNTAHYTDKVVYNVQQTYQGYFYQEAETWMISSKDTLGTLIDTVINPYRYDENNSLVDRSIFEIIDYNGLITIKNYCILSQNIPTYTSIVHHPKTLVKNFSRMQSVRLLDTVTIYESPDMLEGFSFKKGTGLILALDEGIFGNGGSEYKFTLDSVTLSVK